MNQPPLNAISQQSQMEDFNIIKSLTKKLNFEFMDLTFLPNSLRSTLRDILEVGNKTPFRNYYNWSASSIYEYARKNNVQKIVELGAGCAPITKHLIKKYPHWNTKFMISDLNPDISSFKKLEDSDSRVQAMYQPLDFTQKISGFENHLLVLSATFHHVPEEIKHKLLTNLKRTSPHVIIFEPLRPNFISILFVIGALVSGFLTPIFKCKSKNFFRCLLWCWVLPIAPFLFLWDGWVSAIRSWSIKKWQKAEPKSHTEKTLFCTKTILG